MASKLDAQGRGGHVVCWVRHGEGEPVVTFTDPQDDIGYSPLFHSPELQTMNTQLVKLLAHCPDTECPECSRIICPHKDPQHFSFAGCPSCGNDREAA